MSRLEITRAGPLVSVQDVGRPGMLIYGVAASGPMDRTGFVAAESATGTRCGAALEFSAAGLSFTFSGGGCVMGFAGGDFAFSRNGEPAPWPGSIGLADRDMIDIRPGPAGNYGYIRFDHEIDVPLLMGSRSTNVTVGLGGLEGRALAVGDTLSLVALEDQQAVAARSRAPRDPQCPIRFIWGIHADMFPGDVRTAFCETPFQVSAQMDRMGIRLKKNNIFSGQRILSLVSDSVVPGDVQILGDGTPIVLMADHQPTGGYPRIATVIDADRDRFAQIRPGQTIRFQPVTLGTAQAISG